ncbi:hypothetical protein [Roseateles sp.]|uniref:hypothetical protein n=1 Tax=Roseateles sp. TaxID=1971397 RepID=UPI0031D948D6
MTTPSRGGASSDSPQPKLNDSGSFSVNTAKIITAVPANEAPAQAQVITSNALKYQAEISKFTGCPPKQLADHTYGFRVCFSDISDPRNFLPNAILDLNRLDGRAPPPCCSSYAVSLFSSLELLSVRVKAILKTNKKFLQKKGDHYVKISIDATCGRSTVADTHGHFDLFEYAHFNPVAAVAEVGGLAL